MKNFNDMNAKEEILKDLKGQLDGFQTIEKDYPKGSNSWITIQNEISKLQSLITSVESAIFDLPSEDEIKKKLGFTSRESEIFLNGCNFILNYKKQTDGK